jgi:signal peptidase I
VERVSEGIEVNALRLDEGIGEKNRIVQWLHTPDGAQRDSFDPVVVPPDHFLMLGDNRDNSADSRYFGMVPRDLLIGRAVVVLVSADITGNWAPRLERFGEHLN